MTLKYKIKNRPMKRKIFILAIVLLGMITSCSEHKYPNFGDSYKFETGDGNSLEIVNFENTIMVGTEIFDYAFDSTFIVFDYFFDFWGTIDRNIGRNSGVWKPQL